MYIPFRTRSSRHPPILLQGLRYPWKRRKPGGETPLHILEDVYTEWFPHRAKDKDLSLGSFFGKYLGSELPNIIPLPDLRLFRTRLYKKIKSMEHEAFLKRDFMYGYPAGPQRGLYQMRDTFAFIFIVLDKTNRRESGGCSYSRTVTILGNSILRE